MVGCVLCHLKPSEHYILSFAKGRGFSVSAFFKAKNVELLGLYPIPISYIVKFISEIIFTWRSKTPNLAQCSTQASSQLDNHGPVHFS